NFYRDLSIKYDSLSEAFISQESMEFLAMDSDQEAMDVFAANPNNASSSTAHRLQTIFNRLLRVRN
ncbi:MAG: hypothetical protein AAGI90_02775, partial [Chlamydiota bacterium]